jgi:hypothetical protein
LATIIELELEKFELSGEDGKILIDINKVYGFPEKTSHFGGYDCILGIEIKVNSYLVKSYFSSSTGELFEFHERLKKCHSDLNGIAKFVSYERNLDLSVKYDFGKVIIYGKFQKYLSIENILSFEFYSDQSYLRETVEQLEQITVKYGGMKGVS